jgi:hypothetical protein
MRSLVLLMFAAVAGCSLAIFDIRPADAQTRASESAAARTDISAEFSARRRTRRPLTRIKVRPGHRFYRQCVNRYVIEYRATGPTVVPHMRCRWVRG